MFRTMFAVAIAFSLLLCGSAFGAEPQQLFPKGELKTWDREKVGGGKGTLFGKFAITRNEAVAGQDFMELGWVTLQPGDSIGFHKHDKNECTYVIAAGEGVFTDTAGKKTSVRAGDITVAFKGQSHALENTGTEPLVFFNAITLP